MVCIFEDQVSCQTLLWKRFNEKTTFLPEKRILPIWAACQVMSHQCPLATLRTWNDEYGFNKSV